MNLFIVFAFCSIAALTSANNRVGESDVRDSSSPNKGKSTLHDVKDASNLNKDIIAFTNVKDATAVDNAISVHDDESVLYIGMQLRPRFFLNSPNGRFQLLMQKDGNLVIYRQSDKKAIWATGTNQNGGFAASMQQDGNFVIYKADQKTPAWATGTSGRGFLYLKMQDDGNLVLYSISGNYPVWATGTHGNMKMAMNLRTRSLNSTPVVNLGATPTQEILPHTLADIAHVDNDPHCAGDVAVGASDQASNCALNGID